MARGRGRMNKNAIAQVIDSFSSSGTLISKEVRPGEFILDQQQDAIRMVQLSAIAAPGVGRLTVAPGVSGLRPGAISGLVARAAVVPVPGPGGSGFMLPSDGVYLITGHISASGSAAELFKSQILLDNGVVSDQDCFAVATPSGPWTGAAFIPVNGLIHAASGQLLDVQVVPTIGTATTIGLEDTGVPHVNITVVRLAAEELSVNF